MKPLFNLLLILSLAPSARAQRYTPVLSGTTAAAVARDVVTYPASSTGNAALLAAINAGSIPLVSRPPDAAIIGKYSYVFSDTRKDYLNRSFKSDPAPVLFDAVRTAPRLLGNYYDFEPQTALNTALFKRIPSFVTHPKKVLIYPGGLYSGSGDNDLIGRGWTHTSESAKWPGSVYPTNLKRALELANYQAAYNAAMELSSGDPLRTELLEWSTTNPAFEGTHLFLKTEAAAKLYAAKWWQTFKQSDWWGGGVDYFSVNHEVFAARTDVGLDYVAQWYRQIGWITKEIIRLAALEGKTLKSPITDFGNLTHPAPFFFDDTDPSTGFPRYMSVGYVQEPFRGSSQSSPLGAPSDIGALLRDGKAFTGVGSYVQHTMDEQSLFQKNTNGTYKIGTDGGLIYRTDKRTTTITGQSAVIYSGDYDKSILKFYSMAARHATNIYFRAGGKHLPLSTDRQTGFDSVRFSSQFRLDTESESGISPASTGTTDAEFATLNARPLNPDWTEGHALMMYLFSDVVRGWMETQNQTSLGADNGKQSKARASVEIYAKGFQRAAQLNWIVDTPWRLVQPKLWIKNQGIVSAPSADEQFYRKPILMGGIATKDGKPTLWLYGWWPCQDTDRYTDVIVWVNKGAGPVTPGYRVRLKGRKAFLDYWQLPEGAAGLAPKDIYFQFSSLLGEKITWRGDYREQKITVHPVPPAVQENGLNLLASTSGATSSTAPVASLAIKSGYSYSSASQAYTIYAQRTDTETYRAKLTGLDGQANQAPSLTDMEVGAFTDPSGRAWNLRRQVAGVAQGRWVQTVEKKSSGAQAVASVNLSNVSADAVLTSINSVSATVSTIGLAAYYNYSLSNSGTLQIRAKGSGGYTLKIERVDGAPMTMLNADNPVLNSGTFYGFGSVAGEYSMDWTFWNVPQVPLVLTFNLSGATNSVTLVPTIGTAQTILTSPDSPSSTTGTGTPSTTATVGGGFGNVYATNSTYVPLVETARPLGNSDGRAPWPRSYLDNGTTRVGVNLTVGGVIDDWRVAGSENVVNGPVWGNGKMDAGRQIMDAIYSAPNGNSEGPFVAINGQSTGTGRPEGSIGYDPVQGGDEGQDPTYGRVDVHYNDGSKLYVKVTPRHWNLNGTFAQMSIENWLSLDPAEPRAFRRHSRWSFARTDSYALSNFLTARRQEAPCAYLTGGYNHFFYATGQPYTGSPLVERVITEGSMNQRDFLTSEPFICACRPNVDDCIFMYAPHSARFNAAVFNQGYGGGIENPGPTDFNAAYINSAPNMHLEKSGVYDFDAAFFKGTKAAGRQWVYNQPRWTGLPEYVFTSNSRLGWINYKSYDQGEAAITNGLVVKPQAIDSDHRDMSVSLPEIWINGRTVKHLYLKANVVSGTNQFWLSYTKANSSTEYRKVFTIPNDGQDHLIDIDLSGDSDWNGDIVRAYISHIYNFSGSGFPALISSEQWKIYWLSYRNLGN